VLNLWAVIQFLCQTALFYKTVYDLNGKMNGLLLGGKNFAEKCFLVITE